jgi:cysteine desulfurase
MHDVDMASMSGHKIFGPKGIGFLYKNNKVNIVPLIHGSGKFNDLRSGTPPLPLIVALSKACRIALTDLEKKELAVKKLNDRICEELRNIEGIKLNVTKYSIPHILNISFENIRPETFIHAMEDDEIYLSTNTACSSGDLSTSVMAIYNDKRRAMSTIRISLSYVTTNEEITKFLNLFKVRYKELNSLMKGNE